MNPKPCPHPVFRLIAAVFALGLALLIFDSAGLPALAQEPVTHRVFRYNL